MDAALGSTALKVRKSEDHFVGEEAISCYTFQVQLQRTLVQQRVVAAVVWIMPWCAHCANKHAEHDPGSIATTRTPITSRLKGLKLTLNCQQN